MSDDDKDTKNERPAAGARRKANRPLSALRVRRNRTREHGEDGEKNAARAALAHSCFNLSGSLLAAVLLPWFVRLVELISPKGPELEVISRQIANAHTAFNVCCALLWLPFLPWMVRLVCALVPEDR